MPRGETIGILMLSATLIGCGDPVAPTTAVPPAATAPVEVADDPAAVAAVEAAATAVRRNSRGSVVEVDYRGKSVELADLERLRQLPNLRSLLLSDTGIDDDGLRLLTNIETLVHLDLRNCPISNPGLEPLSRLTQLRGLKLSGQSGACTVDDMGMKYLAELQSLQVLGLDFLWISELGLSSLSELPQLRELYLAETTVGNEALEVISRFPELRRLRLARTQIDGQGLVHLAPLDKLEDLDLSECLQLTDSATEPLGELDGLKKLNLWRVNLTDEGIRPVSKLTALEWLNLDNTRLSDAGMPYLSGLKQLQFLHLGSTQISDVGLVHLESLNALRELIVTRTAVTETGASKLQQALPELDIQLEYVAGP